MIDTFESVPFVKGKPTLVMANTVKGKGVSFAENVPHWHHHVPNEDELQQALGRARCRFDNYVSEGTGA